MNFKQWVNKVPQSVKSQEKRFYVFLSVAYVFTFLMHLFFLVPLYTMLTSRVAFWSDCLCILTNILCFILLRRGIMNVSFLLFISYISAHTVLSIVFFGATSCLQFYFFTLLVVTFFSPWRLAFKSIIGFILTCLAVALTSYSLYHPPIVEITRMQLVFWNVGNIAANCFALGYGVYYFSFIVDTAEEKLRYQAKHDLLTGVLNRSAIIKALAAGIAGAKKHMVSVIIGDIDYFKKINDTYGHLIGDEVLKSVTRTLGASLREGDALGRYGGEEFIMVLPDCDLNVALKVAERVREQVVATPVPTEAGNISVTMSFGVAAMQNRGQVDGEGLLKQADEALYRAKNNGRNRVAHF